MTDLATTPSVIPALPEGTVLVHIGPPKTGTSALQAAFHAHRPETLAQGVRYAGASRHSGSAILALGGRPSFGRDQGPPSMSKWHHLVRDVRGAREPRVLVSSEFFAEIEPATIKRAIDDLGRDSAHVVVTLRPLDRLIPSQWQQYVQSGLTIDWQSWLGRTLNEPPGPTPTFWRRHRHDRLVERWVAEVGPDRLTVVVIDESDRDSILRVFERLLALRPGTLVAENEVVNRSMTWPEIEAVRAYVAAFKGAGLGNALFHKSMHFGAASYMKTRVPPPDEPRVVLPDWAMDRTIEVAREMVVGIRGAGVRVLGDLDSLVPADPRETAEEVRTASGPRGVTAAAIQERVCVSPDIAAGMATGMVVVAGHARRMSPAAERAELPRHPTYHLMGAVLGRARRVVGQAIESLTPGGRERRVAPATGAWAGANLATVEAIEARFEMEGLISPRARALLGRGLTIAGATIPGVAGAEADSAIADAGCVEPKAAAWFALSMLEASGAIHGAGERPGKLRPALWWWLEPPELARVPTLRILRALAVGLVRGAIRRFRR